MDRGSRQPWPPQPRRARASTPFSTLHHESNPRARSVMRAVARAPLGRANSPAPRDTEDERARPDVPVLRSADHDAEHSLGRRAGFDLERVAHVRGLEPAAGTVRAKVRPVGPELDDGLLT